MANPEHVKYLLQAGTETWNKWRQENPEIIPDLSNGDWQKINCPRANLIEANIQGAYLQGANLQGANLRGANHVISVLDGTSNRICEKGIWNSAIHPSVVICVATSQTPL